jgi:phage gpG-like protein
MIRLILTGDDKVETRIRGMNEKVRQALVDAVKTQWFALQSYVVRTKLSSQVLHRVTGNLASSINVGGPNTASEFTETPVEIVGRVGTRVVYGAVHEYGGTFKVPAHQRTITQVFGRDVTPTVVSVAAHNVTFPERSFLRSSIQDMGTQIRQSIVKAVQEAMA